MTSSKIVRTSGDLESFGSLTVMRTLQCWVQPARRWVALHLVHVAISNVVTSVSALLHRRQLYQRLKSSAKLMDWTFTSRTSSALGKVTFASGNLISFFRAVVEGVVESRLIWYLFTRRGPNLYVTPLVNDWLSVPHMVMGRDPELSVSIPVSLQLRAAPLMVTSLTSAGENVKRAHVVTSWPGSTWLISLMVNRFSVAGFPLPLSEKSKFTSEFIAVSILLRLLRMMSISSVDKRERFSSTFRNFAGLLDFWKMDSSWRSFSS